MTTPTRSRHWILEHRVAAARDRQLTARMAWARSPNAQTIAATQRADRELDALLEELHAAIKVAQHP